MGLLEQYIEATMIEKQDRYDEARQHRDEGRLLAAIQARAVREILHERLVILDDDHSVMDLVLDAIAAGGQGDGVLPSLALHPTLPDTPLRIDFGKDRLSFPDIPSLPPLAAKEGKMRAAACPSADFFSLSKRK